MQLLVFISLPGAAELHFMVTLCTHVCSAFAYMCNLLSARLWVLTCMWQRRGLIYPGGLVGEGCAVSAAGLSRPCCSGSGLSGIFTDSFYGRSRAANEQP